MTTNDRYLVQAAQPFEFAGAFEITRGVYVLDRLSERALLGRKIQAPPFFIEDAGPLHVLHMDADTYSQVREAEILGAADFIVDQFTAGLIKRSCADLIAEGIVSVELLHPDRGLPPHAEDLCRFPVTSAAERELDKNPWSLN
ncbi:MAG: hypothetical protein AAGE52_43115 [Myxococcota bacterium]